MKIKGYDCADAQCANRWCWTPGEYQHRSLVPGVGSRNTGNVSRQCMHRAYHGCPDPLPNPGDQPPFEKNLKERT